MLWQFVRTQNTVLWRFKLETAPEQKGRLPQWTPTNRASLKDGKKRENQEGDKNNISQNCDHNSYLVALGP
jgi:hypothetical protein